LVRLGSSLISRFTDALIQWITIAVLTAAASYAFAQQNQKTTGQTRKAKTSSAIDFSLGTFGELTPTRTPIESFSGQQGTSFNQTTQGASASAGVLGTFHQSFKPWLGYIVNLGYSRFSENYSSGSEFIANPANPPPVPY
jgi:hypothetical protein